MNARPLVGALARALSIGVALAGCIGGQTGQNESAPRCHSGSRPLAAPDELGFSEDDVLARVGGSHMLAAFWPVETQRAADGSLLVVRSSGAARVRETGCEPNALELDVHVELDLQQPQPIASKGAVLHAVGEGVLRATSVENATLTVDDIAVDFTADLVPRVGAELSIDRFTLSVTFAADTTSGELTAIIRRFDEDEDIDALPVAQWPR